MAYWKWREIVGNCEEGIRVSIFAVSSSISIQLKRNQQFYNGFSELLSKFKETVQNWVYGRRSELR